MMEWKKIGAVMIVLLIATNFVGIGLENNAISYNKRNIPLSTYDISDIESVSMDIDLLNYFIISSFYKKLQRSEHKYISFIIKESESLFFQNYSVISVSDVSPPSNLF